MQIPRFMFSSSIRRSRQALLVYCIVAIGCLMVFRLSRQVAAQADANTRQPVQRVRAADIGKTVQIVGELGHDLGEVLTIRGKWEFGASKFGSEFNVTHVNGEKLEHPIAFSPEDLSDEDYLKHRKMPKRKDGDVWELTVVELGGYRGEPAGLVKFKYPRMMPGNPFGSGFSTYLKVLDYSDPKPKTKPKGKSPRPS